VVKLGAAVGVTVVIVTSFGAAAPGALEADGAVDAAVDSTADTVADTSAEAGGDGVAAASTEEDASTAAGEEAEEGDPRMSRSQRVGRAVGGACAAVVLGCGLLINVAQDTGALQGPGAAVTMEQQVEPEAETSEAIGKMFEEGDNLFTEQTKTYIKWAGIFLSN
jgi:hypothetical protein